MEKLKLECGYVYNQQDLIKLIKNHCEEAKKIDLYTCDFLTNDSIDFTHSIYFSYDKKESLNGWLKDYLFTLANKNIKIEVYNYRSIDDKNLEEKNEFYLDHKGEKYDNEKENTLKIISKQNDNSKILYDFINYLNPNHKKNLSEVIDEIMKKYEDKGLAFLKEGIQTKLKEPLLQKLSSLEEIKTFNQDKFQENLNLTFNNLLESIENIFKEGYSYVIKELLNFFLNIVNIFEIKKIFTKGNIFLLGADILFEGGKTFINILDWSNNKYSYVIYNSIIRLFTQDIAPILTLIENNIFHHTLIIDDKILIELSSFKTDMQDIQSYMKQDLVLCIKANKECFKDFKNIDFKNLIPKNKEDGSEELALYDKNSIQDALTHQMSLDNNRLAYIESPFFNSIKFTQMIKKANQAENNASYALQNYLIISNAPRKYNAGLSKKLIQDLGNTISYPDITEDEIQSEQLLKAPKDDYNTTIDYSKYTITIKDEEKEAYVLSLSPFVRLNYEEYIQYEDAKKTYELLLLDIKIGNIESFAGLNNFILEDKNVRNLRNYNYIDTFFVQTDKKQAFLDKEKEYFKEGIECLQNYINSIIKYKKNVTRYYGTIVEECPKTRYSIVEVLLLTLTYYVIKNFYTSVNTDFVAWWEIENLKSYESIKVDEESIDLLPKDVELVLENNTSISLCFSKKRKDKLLKSNKEIFCIEEVVEKIEKTKGEDFTDEDDKTIETYLQSSEEYINLNLISDEDNENLNELETLLNEQNYIDRHISNDLDKAMKEAKVLEDYKSPNTIPILIALFTDKFFPFAELLKGDDFIFAKKFSKSLITFLTKDFQMALYDTLGLGYLISVLNQSKIKIVKTQKISDQKEMIKRFNKLKKQALLGLILIETNKNKFETIVALDETKFKKLKKFKGFKDLRNIKKNILEYKFNFTLHTIKNINKDILSSLPQALVQNFINQLWISEYEKSIKEFQRLQFLKFTYKYNAPYAIKRAKEAIFYPMLINNTFLSFNFTSLFIGSHLQTGGLGEKESLFFYHKDLKTQRARTYLLNKLLAYLCLDELRAMNDSFKLIEDREFFNTRAYTKDLVIAPRLLKLKNENFFKTHNLMSENQKNNIEAFNDKLQAINDDLKRQALYKEYKDNEAKGIEAIDAYHKAMDYLDDMQRGAFNTKAYDNSPEPKKHREFLKALDVIGQNNIKALYVGLNEENEEKSSNSKQNIPTEISSNINNQENHKQEKEKRPKLIGRLATTIIMKNGLFIG